MLDVDHPMNEMNEFVEIFMCDKLFVYIEPKIKREKRSPYNDWTRKNN